jgi:hypothetical protein
VGALVLSEIEVKMTELAAAVGDFSTAAQNPRINGAPTLAAERLKANDFAVVVQA